MVTNTTSQSEMPGCELFPDRADYCDALSYCKKISAALSIIGCVFTIGVIWLFRKYKEFAQRMILHVCGAALLLAIFYVLNDIEPTAGALCTIQGAGITFAIWAVLLWVLTIVLNLYLIVVRSQSLEKYERLCAMICWFLPLVFAILPLTDDAYGPAGAWCWLKNRWGWRYGLWYIWSILSVVLMFVTITYIVCYLRRHPETRDGRADPTTLARIQSLREDARQLRVYPVIYFFINLFLTINRLQNYIAGVEEHGQYVFPLLLLHTIMLPLYGAVIAVVFVLDRRTLNMLTPINVKNTVLKRIKRTRIIEMDSLELHVHPTTSSVVGEENYSCELEA